MKYKDPITGEIKDIYVKALDNLPVGAIVDYDGDTVPDGYEEVENEKILYESNGSNETITLSDSSANYSYLEIFYQNNDGKKGSLKIEKPNNAAVSLETSSIFDTAIYFKFASIIISGTTITFNRFVDVTMESAKNTFSTSSKNIYITKVIGYKEV